MRLFFAPKRFSAFDKVYTLAFTTLGVMGVASPGNPGGQRNGQAPMAHQPEHGTSHISIIDAHGNALAMTTVREQASTSGVQAIQAMPGGWFGGADPRREGVVVGQ